MANVCEVAANNIQAFKKAPIGQADLLQRSVKLAEKNPRLVLKKFLLYYRVIKDLFNLTPEEMSVIKSVNSRFYKISTDENEPINKNNKNMKPYENRGADKFLEAMSGKKNELLAYLRQIGNLDNPQNQEGMTSLMRMMNNAWEIKQTEPGWSPQDGDQRSNEVIWGFVKGASHPDIDIDFTLCHGIERILTAHFPDVEFTKHKDWLLCALNDVIALKGLKKDSREKELYLLWARPRPEGLGWITNQRAAAFMLATLSSQTKQILGGKIRRIKIDQTP